MSQLLPPRSALLAVGVALPLLAACGLNPTQETPWVEEHQARQSERTVFAEEVAGALDDGIDADSEAYRTARERLIAAASAGADAAALLPEITAATTAAGGPTSYYRPAGDDGVAMAPVDVEVRVDSDGAVTTVTLPSLVGSGIAQGEEYSQSLRQALVDLDGQTCGYVVDLRGTGGVISAPLLEGLTPAREHPERPLAILQGPGTSDAGEAVLVGLDDGANVHTFGEPTAGQALAYSTTTFSDGSELHLATGPLTRVDGSQVTRPLEPDVTRGATSGSDEAMVVARDWLARQGCS